MLRPLLRTIYPWHHHTALSILLLDIPRLLHSDGVLATHGQQEGVLITAARWGFLETKRGSNIGHSTRPDLSTCLSHAWHVTCVTEDKCHKTWHVGLHRVHDSYDATCIRIWILVVESVIKLFWLVDYWVAIHVGRHAPRAPNLLITRQSCH